MSSSSVMSSVMISSRIAGSFVGADDSYLGASASSTSFVSRVNPQDEQT